MCFDPSVFSNVSGARCVSSNKGGGGVHPFSMQRPTGLIIGGIHYPFTIPDKGSWSAEVLYCEGASHVLARLGGLRHGAGDNSSEGGEHSALGVNFNDAPRRARQAGVVSIHT